MKQAFDAASKAVKDAIVRESEQKTQGLRHEIEELQAKLKTLRTSDGEEGDRDGSAAGSGTETETEEEEQGDLTLQDKIDDALEGGFEDVAAIEALLSEAQAAKHVHPSVLSLQNKLETLRAEAGEGADEVAELGGAAAKKKKKGKGQKKKAASSSRSPPRSSNAVTCRSCFRNAYTRLMQPYAVASGLRTNA